MQQPLDYPLDDLPDEPTRTGSPSDPSKNESAREDSDAMTYAALLDRYASQKPITDEMIHHACYRMDAAQQFPFTGGDEGSALSIRKLFRIGV